MSLFLSRATLRRDAPIGALRRVLIPDDDSARAGMAHRLMWTLFSDGPDRERDFLWRETDAGRYYILSRRVPEDRHGLFELDPAKSFAPELHAGDHLAFSLRANATIARKAAGAKRGKPSDIVMNALYSAPGADRAELRRDQLQVVGATWLGAQGRRCGFAIADAESERPAVSVTGYRVLQIDHAGPTARIGVLDFDGVLEVRDPLALTTALGQGIGRAKAFGCGLMLVRRA